MQLKTACNDKTVIYQQLHMILTNKFYKKYVHCSFWFAQ